MNFRQQTTRSVTSVLARLFTRSKVTATRLLRRRKNSESQAPSRRSRRPNLIETLEIRALLASTNIAAVRPDLVNSPFLLEQYLDTDPLGGPRDSAHEITFDFGFSSISVGAGTLGNDIARAGDLSGVGYDQSVVVRGVSGALQWLGDTDRDTTQEYLFRFGLSDMTPLIADMNSDGYDDVIAVDRTTVSGLNEWYVHYAVPGSTHIRPTIRR